MTAKITALHTRLLTVPLRRSWGVEAPENHIIATTVETDDGGTGHGFSWTPTIGPQAVKALLDHDIAGFAVGLPADPEPLWDALWLRLHEAGGGGLTTIAMAGLDLALWDLAGTIHCANRPSMTALPSNSISNRAPCSPSRTAPRSGRRGKVVWVVIEAIVSPTHTGANDAFRISPQVRN